jgi:hypothetical protein
VVNPVSNRASYIALASKNQFVPAKQNLDLARVQAAYLRPYHKSIAGFENIDRWPPRGKTALTASCRLATEVDQDIKFEARFHCLRAKPSPQENHVPVLFVS